MQKQYLVICTLLIFSCQEPPQENIYIPPLEKESFDNKLYINLAVNDFWSKISKINLLDNKIHSFDENKKK